MNAVHNYLKLVKFSHTVFALPFAMIGFFWGLHVSGQPISLRLFLQVLLCMVFARNAAMGFNRYADRRIDAQNSRTARREIPAGIISPRKALIFVIINGLLFLITAITINPLTAILSPLALIVILSYSLTKRFTALCHLILGLSLSIAPVGAYIAVTGHWGTMPLLLSVAIIGWVAGFDIFYALQDETFDRSHCLHSIPARFGKHKALFISLLLRIVTLICLIGVGIFFLNHTLYWCGLFLFVLLLVYQHLIVRPHDLSRVNLAFATLNGTGSVVYAIFTIFAICIH